MNRIFTHDYLFLEEEATKLLAVYEAYTDDKQFENTKAIQAMAKKLKSYARSYHFVKTSSCNIEYVSN